MFDLLFCPDSWRHCRQRYGVTSSGRLTAGCAARIAMRFAWATPTATATSAPSLARPRRGAVPLTPTWLAMTRYGICNNGMWCPRFQMRVSKCMGRLPTVRTPTSFRRSIGCIVFMSRGASYTRLYYLRTLYRCTASRCAACLPGSSSTHDTFLGPHDALADAVAPACVTLRFRHFALF